MNSGNPRGVQLIFRSPWRLGRWVAPPISTGPSPPLHLTLQHRAGQLMLLPPEWAPWRTRQWQSEADKRAAIQYRLKKKMQASAEHTLPLSVVLIQETVSPLWLIALTSLLVTVMIRIARRYACMFTYSCCDGKYWLLFDMEVLWVLTVFF